MTRVVVLHPGAMGSEVGACLVGNGHDVGWVAAGRSAATAQRAETAELSRHDSLDQAIAAAEFVLSVCPPDNAIEVASAVGAAIERTGADVTYVDANAIAPVTMSAVADGLTSTGTPVVDGGIVGPPPTRAGTTRLYLSGEGAGDIAALFAGSPLECVDMGDTVGHASALKMAYAAWTKGSTAMLLAVAAAAEAHGVADHLHAEWDRSQPGLTDRLARTGPGVAPKAWRWQGEMEEIAATLAQYRLPAGFHLAAAETWRRLADLKDTDDVDTDVVLDRLLAR